jgi:NAD(P)-dependent dehydrogenase (short-subunit alcohol dehydrogenase family)
MSVAGKIVLITGAGGGVGRALAVGFGGDGALLALCDRNTAALTETASLCGAGELHTRATDLSDDHAVGRFVQETLSRFGRIDVLINSAGISDSGPFLSQPFADWARVIAVNLTGLASCIYHVLPGMLDRGHGRVINLVSREAESPRPQFTALAASSAGAISLMRAVALGIDRGRYPDVLVNVLLTDPAESGLNQPPGLAGAAGFYPQARYLAELPAGGPSGRIFWQSRDYPFYTRFNEAQPSGGQARQR